MRMRHLSSTSPPAYWGMMRNTPKKSRVLLSIACIFSQVDVSLGERLITQSSGTYSYRCLIEALINFCKDTLESIFSVGLLYRDTAGHMDATYPAGESVGLMKRAAFTNASNVGTFSFKKN